MLDSANATENRWDNALMQCYPQPACTLSLWQSSPWQRLCVCKFITLWVVFYICYYLRDEWIALISLWVNHVENVRNNLLRESVRAWGAEREMKKRDAARDRLARNKLTTKCSNGKSLVLVVLCSLLYVMQCNTQKILILIIQRKG
jgi:hypothetical protein